MAIPNIEEVVKATNTLLRADSTLTAKLGTFLTAPCIFTGHVVPSAAPRPYIHIRTPVALSDFSSKDLRGWEVTFELLIVSDRAESGELAYEISDIVLEDLHRASLTITGETHLLTECTGMSPVNTSDDLSAILLTFTVLFMD